MFSTPNIRVRPAATENAFSLTAKKALSSTTKKTAFQDISVNITPFKVKEQKKHIVVNKEAASIKKEVIPNDDLFDVLGCVHQHKDTYEDILSTEEFNDIINGFKVKCFTPPTPPPKDDILTIDMRFFEQIKDSPLDKKPHSIMPWHDAFVDDGDDVSLPDLSF